MINLNGVFKTVNNIKKGLLSEFTTLKFIGINSVLTSKPRIYLGTLNENWYYRERRDPITGAITEHIDVVTTGETQFSWVENCSQIELVRANGSFLRFTLSTKLKPKPPKFQWEIMVRPNGQDQAII